MPKRNSPKKQQKGKAGNKQQTNKHAAPNVKRRSGGKSSGKVAKPKPKSATELDAELATYMVQTKGGLD